MTPERVFNVFAWRRGHNVGMVSRIGRDPAAAERSRLAHQDSGLDSLYLIGRWRVRDHSGTIAALCGTAGRIR